jgi:CBS domain-containing protein
MYEFLTFRVEDAMSQPVTISRRTTLAEVEERLEKRGFNALPVVDDEGHLLGLVSSLDLLRAFAFGEDTILPPYHDIMARPVETVMARDVQTVRPRTPLPRVLQKIVDSGFKSFPVVDGAGLVVGVVAREDVMRSLRGA